MESTCSQGAGRRIDYFACHRGLLPLLLDKGAENEAPWRPHVAVLAELARRASTRWMWTIRKPKPLLEQPTRQADWSECAEAARKRET